MPATRSIVIRKTLPAPCPRVFAAWSRPELLGRWFFPASDWRAEVAADVRVGGRYRIAMHDPAGGVHVQEGVYRLLEPNSRLVFTWCCPELGVEDSLVSIDLVDRGASTELVLRHDLPDDPKILREHEGGWQGCLATLLDHLSTHIPGGSE